MRMVDALRLMVREDGELGREIFQERNWDGHTAGYWREVVIVSGQCKWGMVGRQFSNL